VLNIILNDYHSNDLSHIRAHQDNTSGEGVNLFIKASYLPQLHQILIGRQRGHEGCAGPFCTISFAVPPVTQPPQLKPMATPQQHQPLCLTEEASERIPLEDCR
jgi:hypothetical protein